MLVQVAISPLYTKTGDYSEQIIPDTLVLTVYKLRQSSSLWCSSQICALKQVCEHVHDKQK